MNELNDNEEKIMLILWQLKEAMVKEIMDQMEKPVPPYTTVSSVVRLLEKKVSLTIKLMVKHMCIFHSYHRDFTAKIGLIK